MISSVGIIISTVSAIIVMIISINALESKPKRPNLVLLKEKIQNTKSRIIVYNGGDGPCAEFKITYKNEFESVKQIVQYQESVITNAKLKGNKIMRPLHSNTTEKLSLNPLY